MLQLSRLTYSDSIRSNDQICRCFCSVFEADSALLMVHFDGFVVHLEDTGRSLAGLFKCGFQELLVNVDAMEIVIVLL